MLSLLHAMEASLLINPHCVELLGWGKGNLILYQHCSSNIPNCEGCHHYLPDVKIPETFPIPFNFSSFITDSIMYYFDPFWNLNIIF